MFDELRKKFNEQGKETIKISLSPPRPSWQRNTPNASHSVSLVSTASHVTATSSFFSTITTDKVIQGEKSQFFWLSAHQFPYSDKHVSQCLQLLSDPAESTQALNQQLAALGLYAVQTLGDGNCLFRSLSDQYYGSDSRHALVRKDICDWIAKHQLRYAPFVDDDRGIEVHLRCMRENGTHRHCGILCG